MVDSPRALPDDDDDWEEKIMEKSLTVGGQSLQGKLISSMDLGKILVAGKKAEADAILAGSAPSGLSRCFILGAQRTPSSGFEAWTARGQFWRRRQRAPAKKRN